MERDEDLFHSIIGRLDAGGILTEIVLIGGWVLPVYRAYFDDDPHIPFHAQ